ncbi:MAG TPA: MBL fold metallo-hydrolase [Steroidobacteraceae bacterium]|nr:MBL fold metallo-hydrolase [Steroidobacteraceae bacterium]
MSFSRRTFLRGSAQALGAASLLGALPGAVTPALAAGKDSKPRAGARDITVKDVAGLAVLSGAGCNVVALAGPDGALMIDGGLAANSAVLLKAVADATKTRRVDTLINTHWHPEQTGSNEAVGKAGGTLIAHEVSRLALTRAERSPLFEGSYGPLPEKARPAKITYNTGSLQFAGEAVEYRYLPAAHTNGDLFIHFPRRNVIVAGGPVAADHWPVIDYQNGGFMHGFLRSYEILSEVAQADTVIIPANGPTLTGADIAKQKAMYFELFRMFFQSFNKGYGPMDIVADRPLKAYEAQYGDPAQFLEYAYRSTQLATIPF